MVNLVFKFNKKKFFYNLLQSLKKRFFTMICWNFLLLLIFFYIFEIMFAFWSSLYYTKFNKSI